MRIDKYLKVSRIIKRRTLAQEMCNGGYVIKNGRTAKPSSQVEVGDILDIKFRTKTLSVEVLALADNADKNSASSLYRQVCEKTS